ncbi:MAG: hypothetical protein V5A74_08185, partial [Desulfohalobiaceae bacterium]
RGIANLTVATGKIPISRTTRARLFMKHGFSAHPRLAPPYLLFIQSVGHIFIQKTWNGEP